MSEFTGIPAAAFTFLRGLKRHNDREWFEARRATYESAVRAPLRALVEELDIVCGIIAPEFRGDPKRSVFRIHRDVRFSADKSPYKTHASAWLFHEDAGHGVGRDAHGGAGFYVHIEPGACMVAGGIWMPPKPALDRVRAALMESPASFDAIVRAPAFRRRFGALSDEAMLVRLPRGVAADHPAGPYLRYKSFTVSRAIDDAAMQHARIVRTLRTDLESMLPFVRWLNAALGLAERSERF
jgi:uncharacterized protein (TIGR02453 family)